MSGTATGIRIRVALAVAGLAAAGVLLALDVEPVPTWFYVFAWYPTLVLLDAVARTGGGVASPFATPGRAFSLFAWSVVLWLVFEAFNVRLANWYYVSLPAHPAERWAGIVLSFATVMPAIVLAERALAARGVLTRPRGPAVSARASDLRASVILGIIATGLVLGWPRTFFPLVWGLGWVVAEPLVYHRAPDLSLYRDLERGEWGRVGRLLLGGLGIGLLWESYNHLARGRWIYTVPGLEQLKLFEMPPLGFLGFPVFAVEAWSMYAALCALGVAVSPGVAAGPVRRGRMAVVAVLVAALSAGVLAGMERFTISSTVPRPSELQALGPDGAALARLRGMGVPHARAPRGHRRAPGCATSWSGIRSARGGGAGGRGGPRPTEAEVRVWIRAAQRACDRS